MIQAQGLVERLEVVPLRQVFRNEPYNFTTWLESHIEALSDRVGLRLANVHREQAVGDFNVDLVCEDNEGRRVAIENQLEPTDHKHLGQLLTYLVNLDASTAIWIAAEPRSEHQKVINWLNELAPGDISFYLVKVEAIRIADSPPAPLFTVLAGPDKSAKETGREKKEWGDRRSSRYEFWEGLLERSKTKTKLFSNISPNHGSWIGTTAGKSGVTFNYDILMNWGAVELYIDYDRDTGQRNKSIFDALKSQEDEIEHDFGEPLEWERLDDKRASRIRKRFTSGGFAAPDTWPVLQEDMINAMIKLDRALRPRLAKIQV